MSIFDFLKPKDPRYNHVITDDERMAGATTKNSRLELAKRKAELEQAKLELEAERDRLRIEADIEILKQKLEDLQDTGEETIEGSSTEDTLLTALLTKVLAGQQPQQIQQQPQTAPISTNIEITDQQITDIWNAQDKATKKVIKSFTDDQIKAELRGRMPTISDGSLDRCIEFIRKAKI